MHRALVSGLKLGAGGLPPDAAADFAEQGVHISATERRAATAEREAVDRYVTAYLADKVGATFAARISGVARFGLFVTLTETGADGLVPMGSLPDDTYLHDEALHALIGKRTRRMFQLGTSVQVVLREANPVTGGMVFNLSRGSDEDKARPQAPHRPQPRNGHRPPANRGPRPPGRKARRK